MSYKRFYFLFDIFNILLYFVQERYSFEGKKLKCKILDKFVWREYVISWMQNFKCSSSTTLKAVWLVFKLSWKNLNLLIIYMPHSNSHSLCLWIKFIYNSYNLSFPILALYWFVFLNIKFKEYYPKSLMIFTLTICYQNIWLTRSSERVYMKSSITIYQKWSVFVMSTMANNVKAFHINQGLHAIACSTTSLQYLH